MGKPSMRFIATTKEKLKTIDKVAGQLIFVPEDRAIYLDISSSDRTVYQSIITVFDEATRQAIESPIEGFYYVRQENTLWSYFNATWAQVIGQDSNVVFTDEALPPEGIRDALYVKDTSIYRWNDITNSYDLMTSNGVDWERLLNN